MNKVNNKILFSVFTLLILVVGVLFAVYLSGQEQDPRQRAAALPTPPGTIAVVHGEAITKEMLQKEAEKQYESSAITPDILSIMLELMIEQKLLEYQSRNQNISVSDSVALEQTETVFPDADTITDPMISQVKYTLLREEVSKKLSDTREAYTIGFWLPPSSYSVPLTSSQTQTVISQRRLVPQIVTEVKQRLTDNEVPLEIAQDLLRRYPVLGPILAVNGYLLNTTENEELLTTPVLYTNTQENNNNPFFPVLFSMQPGQVREVTAPSSTGVLVIKVISATNGQFDNYKAWLASQKQQNVRLISPL